MLNLSLISSCIKDDFVDDTIEPEIRITTNVSNIELNSNFQFKAVYFNNIGFEENVEAIWKSADISIIEIDSNGLAFAKNIGSTVISVEFDNGNIFTMDALNVDVSNEATTTSNQSLSSSIQTTSSYELTGDFEFLETENGVEINFASNYKASTALPGLYIYLSNNKNSVANALEVSKVDVFNGAHQYKINNIGFSDYTYIVYFCKPFNVKVGDGSL